MTKHTTETGVSTHDMPDSALACGSETMPCQMLDTILQIDDEEIAKEVMRNISSPLDMDLVDDEDEEPLPLGVPLSDIMSSMQSSKTQRIIRPELEKAKKEAAYLANEIEQMNLLFDTVKEKVGDEQFAGFLGLFSLASRKTTNQDGNKGVWEVTLNGRKINAAKAEFKVTFHLENHHKHQVVYQGESILKQTPSGGNIYRIGSTFCNDNFEIVVSPAFTRYSSIAEYTPASQDYMTGEEFEGKYTDSFQSVEPTKYKTIDELADLLIDEIYNTIQINNEVDWWTDKTLTAVDIGLTAAVICTGVGGAVAVGARLLPRIASIGLVVMESSNAVEATTKFLGVHYEGYNPLFEASRYLDRNIGGGGHKFQATFHGLNMVMAFGKKPVTRHLTALGTGAGTAGVYLKFVDGGQQQVIDCLETNTPPSQ